MNLTRKILILAFVLYLPGCDLVADKISSKDYKYRSCLKEAIVKSNLNVEGIHILCAESAGHITSSFNNGIATNWASGQTQNRKSLEEIWNEVNKKDN